VIWLVTDADDPSKAIERRFGPPNGLSEVNRAGNLGELVL
jgi:hypothetical protein